MWTSVITQAVRRWCIDDCGSKSTRACGWRCSFRLCLSFGAHREFSPRPVLGDGTFVRIRLVIMLTANDEIFQRTARLISSSRTFEYWTILLEFDYGDRTSRLLSALVVINHYKATRDVEWIQAWTSCLTSHADRRLTTSLYCLQTSTFLSGRFPSLTRDPTSSYFLLSSQLPRCWSCGRLLSPPAQKTPFQSPLAPHSGTPCGREEPASPTHHNF